MQVQQKNGKRCFYFFWFSPEGIQLHMLGVTKFKKHFRNDVVPGS